MSWERAVAALCVARTAIVSRACAAATNVTISSGDNRYPFALRLSSHRPFIHKLCTVVSARRLLVVDDYIYDIALKSCQNGPRSSLLASFCAESTCSDDIGDVVQHNLTMTRARKGWEIKHVHVGFNPVSMKLTSLGDSWYVMVRAIFSRRGSNCKLMFGQALPNS